MDAFEVERTILYYGPRSADEIKSIIKNGFLGKEPSRETPAFVPDRSISPEKKSGVFPPKGNGSSTGKIGICSWSL